MDEQIDDVTADFVISQLLLLDSEDQKKDIRMFINSPGGSVTAGEFPDMECLSLKIMLYWNNSESQMTDDIWPKIGFWKRIVFYGFCVYLTKLNRMVT